MIERISGKHGHARRGSAVNLGRGRVSESDLVSCVGQAACAAVSVYVPVVIGISAVCKDMVADAGVDPLP